VVTVTVTEIILQHFHILNLQLLAVGAGVNSRQSLPDLDAILIGR